MNAAGARRQAFAVPVALEVVVLCLVAALLARARPAAAQDCPAHLMNWRTLPAGYVGEQECTYLANCNNPPLQPASGYHCCNDGQDNDGDGLTDANDPDCQHEYLCQDGIDNDGDGLTDGADPDCKCLADVTGFTGCTANDTKIVLIGLGNQTDGCMTGSDSQTIWLRAEITAGANTRYDLGMWIHLDGLTTLTGLCSRRSLKPVTTLNGPYQPATGYGLFDNDDGDACGDTRATDGITVYQYTFPITTPCVPTTDGFLSMGRCGSWAQNEKTTCNGFWEALPGTTSKCRCEENATNIPAPQVSLSCSTNRTEARPGWSVEYTITYSNACTCTPDSRPENVRCCTAAYVRFPFSYAHGTISNLKIDGVAVSPGDPRVVDVFDTNTRLGTLTWTPTSALGTLGIIGGGRTQTLTFTFTVDPNAPAGSLANQTGSEWSADGTFTTVVSQPLSSSCPITVNPTYATVSDVALLVDGGIPTLTWTASAEVGVVGYNVYRRDETAGEWVKVNPYLLPALSARGGSTYRLADPAAPLDGPVTYRIGEREFRGGETLHGPFPVVAGWQAAPAAALDENGFGVAPRPASARLAAPGAAGSARPRVAARGVAAEREDAPAVGSVGAKVTVAGRGLVAVSADQLAAALGSPLAKVQNAVKNGQLTVSNRGRAVAWQGAGDGSRLWFVGEESNSPFAAANVYVVREGRGETMGKGTVAGAAPVSGAWFSETVRFERDLLPRVYLGFAANEDFWYWDFVMSENPSYARKSLPFTLEGVATGAGDASLELFLSAVSDTPASPDGRATVAVNGHEVGETSWDGLTMHAARFTFPSTYLLNGGNTVTITGTTGTLLVEAFTVTYPRTFRAAGDALFFRAGNNPSVTVSGFSTSDIRLYEVSDPARPRALSGYSLGSAADGTWQISFVPAGAAAAYLAVATPAVAAPLAVRADLASDLANKQNRAEYVAIAPAPLLAGATALARLRENAGLSTLVVDLEDVYDEFSFGMPDPEAVRRFVRAAVANWRVPPRFLAIIGKGSFDYRDNLGLGGNLFPPMLAPTAYGLFAADSLFGDVDDDGVPEVAVGRIPAVSVAEVEAYASKLAAYEAAGMEGWAGRAVLLADNADHAGNFPADAETLNAGIPSGVTVERIFLGAPYSAEEARRRVLAAVADGAALLAYVGHAGADRLAAEGLLLSADAGAMTNAPRLPVIAGFTCYANLFAHPGLTSIGEELVLAPAGGAVAVWAPSGLAVNATSVQLGTRFMPAFFAAAPTLGEKVRDALSAFASAGGDGEHLRIYTLLGDPAVAVRGRH